MTKKHKENIAEMEAKHKEEKERLRHEMDATQAQLKQLGEEGERLREQLEEKPKWWETLLSNVHIGFQMNANLHN